MFVDKIDSKMISLRKVYGISKERETYGANVTPSSQETTHPPVSSNILAIIGVSLVSPGSGRPSFGVSAAITEGQDQSPPTNTNRGNDKDQIPLLEEDFSKRTWKSGDAALGSSTSLLKLPTILSS